MKNNVGFPIRRWEEAIAGRKDIEFTEFSLDEKGVYGVTGIIKGRGFKREATWSFDGRCFYRGRRAKSYDINL